MIISHYLVGLDPVTKQSRIMTAEELRTLNPKFYFDPEKMISQLCIDQSLFRMYLRIIPEITI
jgi:hypothetical protein